jgi:hypothetical protein
MHVEGTNVGRDLKVGSHSKFVGRDDKSINMTGNVINLAEAMKGIYKEIDARPEMTGAQKEQLKETVKNVEKELSKDKEEPNQSFLTYLFKDIASMAPDILDVVLATLKNPLAGISEVALKIAQKAAQDAKKAAPAPS